MKLVINVRGKASSLYTRAILFQLAHITADKLQQSKLNRKGSKTSERYFNNNSSIREEAGPIGQTGGQAGDLCSQEIRLQLHERESLCNQCGGPAASRKRLPCCSNLKKGISMSSRGKREKKPTGAAHTGRTDMLLLLIARGREHAASAQCSRFNSWKQYLWGELVVFQGIGERQLVRTEKRGDKDTTTKMKRSWATVDRDDVIVANDNRYNLLDVKLGPKNRMGLERADSSRLRWVSSNVTVSFDRFGNIIWICATLNKRQRARWANARLIWHVMTTHDSGWATALLYWHEVFFRKKNLST